MKLLATSLLLLVGLVVASAALATDFSHKGGLAGKATPTFKVTAVFQCDNNNAFNAYFQDTNFGYGNHFNFGAVSRLSAVTFAHFGFGFAGPYNYDLEAWDMASCTKITSIDGLVAGDAGSAPAAELINTCDPVINLTGDVGIVVDGNSCLAANDCYPDVLFDDQANVNCPVAINLVGFACFDLASQSGPFLLRVETNNCPVPVKSESWGAIKQIYR